MDDTSLYVSNYLREIQVPLRQVAAVTENRWVNIHPVTIQFRSATEFGDRVVFMPRRRWFGWGRSHPVVAEIRHAVGRAPRPRLRDRPGLTPPPATRSWAR